MFLGKMESPLKYFLARGKKKIKQNWWERNWIKKETFFIYKYGVM